MPYKYQISKKKIPRELDRRVKLTEEDKEKIKSMYFFEKMAIRAIAREFEDKCCRKAIHYVLFPERLARANMLLKERRKDGRYKPTRKEWAATMREHRQYKQSIKDKLI